MQTEMIHFDAQSQNPINFLFQGHEVRMVPGLAEMWMWCAGQDVFAAAGLAWNGRNSIKNLPNEWVKVLKVDTTKGEKEAFFIAEPGVYWLLSRSNKPKPLAMFRWIFEEVLPSIRVNGFFGEHSWSDRLRQADQMMRLVERMDAGSNTVVDALYPIYVQVCGRLRIQPLPITRFKDNQLEIGGL